MKKYVICIPASDDFALATAVLIYSIKKNLTVFDQCDVKVVYNDLNEASQHLISKVYSDIKFEKPVDSSYYRHIPSTIYGPGNYGCYLSFEAFSQTGYNKSIYFDADMLCSADFSDIVKTEKQMVWKYPNNGLMIVGHKYLTGETYRKMIDVVINTNMKNRTDGDQATAQQLFNPSNQDVKVVSELYNFQNFGAGGKGSHEEYQKSAKDVKIIHYSGRRKPWASIWDGEENNKNCIRFATLMNNNDAIKLWYKYYDEFREQYL